MSIIDKLKTNIEATTGLPFVYGSAGDINRALDYSPLPCVFVYLLTTTSVSDVNGQLHERATVAAFFVNKTVFDFDGIENEGIIDEMKRRAFAWVAASRSDKTLTFGAVENAQRVYDEISDATVTGYAVQITIEEIEGVGTCNAPETPNNNSSDGETTETEL